MSNNYIRFEQISKSFGSVQALTNVSFGVDRNEIIALMGDNGAGKSTLMKIFSGIFKPTQGEIFIESEKCVFDNYKDAQKAGIETIYQDLAVAPQRTVMENIFLGKEIINSGKLGHWLRILDKQKMRREAESVLSQLNLHVDINDEVGTLSGGEQQSIAVARALQSNPNILIMDEPTSALSVEAVNGILDLIERLRDQGVTIILIDHNLDEVFQVADRVAVLASGQFMGSQEIDTLTQQDLIQMMMGKEKSEIDSD